MGATYHRVAIIVTVVGIVTSAVAASAQSQSPAAAPVVRPQSESAAQAQTAELQKDTLWNGFGWGFLAGVGFGTVTMPGYLTYNAIGADKCTSGPRVECYVPMGLVFGAVGALIDWRIKGDSVAIEPKVSHHHKSVGVVVRF